MDDAIEADTSGVGTDAWRNWRVWRLGAPELENYDDELQSDAAFVGGPVIFGPYQLSSVIRWPRSFGTALIVTGGIHTDLTRDVVVDGKLAEPDSSAYHGGTMTHEVASLVSLELGVRLRVAGTRRLSGFHRAGESDDPMHFDVPRLADPSASSSREVLPQVVNRPADLGSLRLLDSFPSIAEPDQAELVRAARSYAASLWWANEDPNLAWLQLVTAVEAAATRRQSTKPDSMDLVKEYWPELAEMLGSTDAATKKIAARLAQQTRAGRKFQDFLVECAPFPPTPRPTSTLDWEPAGLRACARIIYAHRSKALHEGKPFPMPMLEPPRVESSGAIAEVPEGLGASGLGGSWLAVNTPMYLATFEHIARGALLKWWEELATAAAPDVPLAPEVSST